MTDGSVCVVVISGAPAAATRAEPPGSPTDRSSPPARSEAGAIPLPPPPSSEVSHQGGEACGTDMAQWDHSGIGDYARDFVTTAGNGDLPFVIKATATDSGQFCGSEFGGPSSRF